MSLSNKGHLSYEEKKALLEEAHTILDRASQLLVASRNAHTAAFNNLRRVQDLPYYVNESV